MDKFYKMSSTNYISLAEDGEQIISIESVEGDCISTPSKENVNPDIITIEKKTKSQLAKEERAKKAAFKAKQQEILKAKEAEELELGKARDAEEAAKKKEINILIKQSAREHAELDAFKRQQQKDLEAAEKLAAKKRANRFASNPCSSGGYIGCNCTWCRISPTNADRMAAALDGESYKMTFGNSKGESHLKDAYLRGGTKAVEKAMK